MRWRRREKVAHTCSRRGSCRRWPFSTFSAAVITTLDPRVLLAAANVIPPFENRPRLFVMFPVYYMATYFLQGFSNPPRATAAGRRSHRYACNPPVLHRPSKQQQLLRANQKSMLPHIVYSLHRSGPMDLCHTVTTRVLVVVSEKDAAKKRRRRLCPAGSMGDCPCEMDHHSSGGVGGVVGLMAYRLKRRGLEGRHEVTLK